MEWYTIVVIVGVFGLWTFTSMLMLVISYIMTFSGIEPESISSILHWAHVPSVFVDLLSFFPHMLIVGLYLSYKVPEWKTGKCHWFWDYHRRVHFQMKEYDPPKKSDDTIFLYATFPHGLYATTTMIYFVVNEAHLDVVTAATSIMFWIPFLREFPSLGGVIPANTHDIVEQLDSGKHVALVPEGLRGLFYNSNKGTLELLERRKGFIRCALGSSNIERICIVPVHMDGERNLNNVWMPWPWLQEKLLSKFYYPWPILSWGLWWCPFWPKATPVNVRFGKPIPVKGKTVDQVHDEFMQQVERLLKPLEQESDLSELENDTD